MLKDKGLCAKYIIARKPAEAPVAERAIPTVIFHSDANIKRKFLRTWLKDYSLNDVDMREVIDWNYYKERLAGTILKILIIPAALQKVIFYYQYLFIIYYLYFRLIIHIQK
jgi:DNA polymerase epsilon subunit 1